MSKNPVQYIHVNIYNTDEYDVTVERQHDSHTYTVKPHASAIQSIDRLVVLGVLEALPSITVFPSITYSRTS